MIEVRDISFAYGKNQILNHVGFTAQPGECVGILGNNGAGKSTLITCINRIRTPQSGEVVIDGKSVRHMGRNEMARTIAYVAQKNEMNHATVFDCVLLGRKPFIEYFFQMLISMPEQLNCVLNAIVCAGFPNRI